MEGNAADKQAGAHAELPGVKLWFIDTGGAGEPVMLLHPNTGTSETWEPQIAGLSQAGYRVIAFDRGWGKSFADKKPGAASPKISMHWSAISNLRAFTCSASRAAALLRWTMPRGGRSGHAA